MDAFREVAADLRRRLAAHVADVEERAVEIVPARVRPSGQRSPGLPAYP
jgi:hypothetical protein